MCLLLYVCYGNENEKKKRKKKYNMVGMEIM